MSTTTTTDYHGKVLSPTKLAHVVLQTNNFEHMKRFYLKFLGARVVKDTGLLCFLTYDDEHHRIALLNRPCKDKDPDSSGLLHIAFTFDNLKDLCTAYKQRKALGIEPGWCVNHGPTTSMYYRDPDGNQLETQVDNFDDPDEATAMMETEAFAENSLGADFDPEELCAAVERGDDDATLKIRKDVGPRGAEAIPQINAALAAAPVGA